MQTVKVVRSRDGKPVIKLDGVLFIVDIKSRHRFPSSPHQSAHVVLRRYRPSPSKQWEPAAA